MNYYLAYVERGTILQKPMEFYILVMANTRNEAHNKIKKKWKDAISIEIMETIK